MTLIATIPTLQTERLVLRAPRVSDVSDVEHYIANAPGAESHSDGGPLVNIWRHHKGALT
jgi:hypothetical protein|tara:strand:- start:441 stop:620 length:180 start_codon:yes stop_codon:yes gene_type:complete